MKTPTNYNAWQVNAKDFPREGSLQDKISFLIKYGVLAPSVHNTQPWQFQVGPDFLLVTANPDLLLPHADPTGRGLQIALGCCVTNIEVAAAHFGLSMRCDWAAEGILLSFVENSKGNDEGLFAFITKRYSAKLPYEPKELSRNDYEKLIAVSKAKHTALTMVTDRPGIQRVALLQREATLGYVNNRAFFQELGRWMRPTGSTAEDGMPGSVIGATKPQSVVMRGLIRRFKPAVKVIAKKDAQVLSGSSGVGFITTRADNPIDWFEAGRYYERLALKATALGLATTPLAAMVETASIRSRLTNEYKLPGDTQIFFRIGYSKHKVIHTPRRNTMAMAHMESQKQLAKTIDTPVDFKQIQVDQYMINFIVAGKGRPLLLLHGANIGWPQWYKNIGELAKHFKVYALDLPGAGNSTLVKFHKMEFETFAGLVDKFVNKLGLKDLDVVGSSFGGWIALRLAIEHKPYIRKVVLANPLGLTTHMPAKFRPVSIRPLAVFMTKTALRPVRGNKNLEKFMRDVFYDKQLPLAPEFVDYFYELSKKSHNLLFISRLAHFKGMRKELFLRNDLPKIDKPVLLIWGKEDVLMPFSTVEENIKAIPTVHLEALEHVGHMPPVEAPDTFNKLVINYLK